MSWKQALELYASQHTSIDPMATHGDHYAIFGTSNGYRVYNGYTKIDVRTEEEVAGILQDWGLPVDSEWQ